MTLRKGQIVEIEIIRMAFGGQGIGKINGFVIFVRGTVPGDEVSARIYKKRRDYAEASLIEILKPSPQRLKPLCPYSGYCGGCQWQHVRYESQLQYKKEHVIESMERLGHIKDIVVHSVVPSSDIFGYRNKMEFSFSDRRWFLPDEMDRREIEGGFALGLHVPGTFSKVIDMKACLLQHNTGNQILDEVSRYVKNCGTSVYGLKTHEGFWRFLTIRYSKAFDEWMVNVVTSEERLELVQPLVEILCRKVGQIRTVVNNINSRKASIAIGEHEIILAGDGHIKDRIGQFTFNISANSFFQTNSSAALKLYEKVMDYAEFTGKERVIDLYSGTGTIPIFIASKVGQVTGIEINTSAVLDAERNCMELGIDNCDFICGDIRQELSSIDFRPDVLIIDPPRAGMHKDVLAQVLEISPEKIVYVSCNPSTMARDVSRMIDNYDLVEIQPVDMFPHTYHIEAVAKLQLRNK
ncbi:MAG: 23S rRNA (uracil(1939)-C(5))-methyltransferase RlmD [Thermodesulfobacteriota bacterium]|nr:23S rRNA (uracil(1939)-C(5))-methyltransferase RlmD [Thermodesulfobacteriota bacterium]